MGSSSQANPEASTSNAVIPDVEMGSVSDSAMDLDPDPAVSHHSPSPPRTQSGRLARKARIPRRFVDVAPAAPAPLPAPQPLPESGGGRILPRVILIVRDTIRTGINKFGLLLRVMRLPLNHHLPPPNRILRPGPLQT
ncbi:hypothetical protein PLICRDRAFT_180267 [Plicaturopsis crispa FD-325 SS-3]|uniref:Unplaced genomic scaffold PLICRscaffold_22, whole genome shotgun sequence n=1 Tax=Plicaturopsis crispa FD-325 SS-3 TaxID=944288 RepID=A0A0C9SKF9_PLICR|nr:hypothetical protein PLICRDRAFT_180267 [Plicaturopsis crispa FD-325 SS-3]